METLVFIPGHAFRSTIWNVVEQELISKYDIIKLDCVKIANLTKKDIPRGHWKNLTELEVSNLKMI